MLIATPLWPFWKFARCFAAPPYSEFIYKGGRQDCKVIQGVPKILLVLSRLLNQSLYGLSA